jgi:tetratricopeptide (TPR) repeat protein
MIRIQRMPKKNSARKKLNRQQRRDLDIEISFIEGIVNRDPMFVEALQILGDGYTRRGRYEDGLKIDQRLAQISPDDSLVQYNLACSYSLTNRVDEALAALERALKLGYRDYKWLAEDPDLAKVRRHPHFQEIRAKLRILQIKVG